MATIEAVQRLKELKVAAEEYFVYKKARLKAEYDFLDAISKKRGGIIGLQDANAAGASQILVDTIVTYLGKSNSPSEEG
jgi:hypothetical protein